MRAELFEAGGAMVPWAPGSASPAAAEEALRLSALDRYAVLDTAPEPAFERIADLARSLFGTPIALVSLLDGTRQWFKARRGLDVTETPRDRAFCAHPVLSGEPMVVPDARRDARFATNPLVTGGPRIRFYAGAPVVSPDGLGLGTVCVASPEPRPGGLSRDDTGRLAALATMVAEALELRLRGRLLSEAVETRNAALARAEAATAERDLLAREADHRIRNELQRLHGVISMQIGAAADGAARMTLEAAARRVLAIAATHRYLHDAPKAGIADAGAYLAALVADLVPPDAAGADRRRVETDTTPGLLLPAALLSRLGLVASELVSNALKHGAGRTLVQLRRGGQPGEVVLAVSDEGWGFPPGFDPEALRGSLGMRLVCALAGRGNVAVDEFDRRRIRVRLRSPDQVAGPE